MAGREQITRVDEVAHNKRLLESKAKTLVGQDVRLDDTNMEVQDLDSVDSTTACAILVKRHGGTGAVYVHAQKLEIILIGPDREKGWLLVRLDPGQSYRFYGNPSVQYFRPLS